MQYNSTISYESKRITAKVTNKELEGKFQLPDFLKTLRVSRGHTIQQFHGMTDASSEDCKKYEDGELRIPKEYLDAVCSAYNIPRKISVLGFVDKKDIKQIIGTKIKQLRTQRELSQVELAFEMGLSRATLAGYEVGKSEPDVVTLIKIADFFSVSVDCLIGRTDK